MARLTMFNTANIAQVNQTSGVYCISHYPTKSVYFGSTINLRERIRQWFYAVENPTTRTRLPDTVRYILKMHGNHTPDWFYAVLREGLPPTFNPKLAVQAKPEWIYVQAQQKRDPSKLLNILPTVERQYAATLQKGNKGCSPLRYLKGRLGKGLNRYYNGQPNHNWPVDKRALISRGNTNVPFAVYLQRSMENNKPRHMNPSPAAIEVLFNKWVHYVPPQEPARQCRPVSINSALTVPVPKGYFIPDGYPTHE